MYWLHSFGFIKTLLFLTSEGRVVPICVQIRRGVKYVCTSRKPCKVHRWRTRRILLRRVSEKETVQSALVAQARRTLLRICKADRELEAHLAAQGVVAAGLGPEALGLHELRRRRPLHWLGLAGTLVACMPRRQQ